MELFKPLKDSPSLQVCSEKIFMVLGFGFFVNDVISGVVIGFSHVISGVVIGLFPSPTCAKILVQNYANIFDRKSLGDWAREQTIYLYSR